MQGRKPDGLSLLLIPSWLVGCYLTSLGPQAASLRSACPAEHQGKAATSILDPMRPLSCPWIGGHSRVNRKFPHSLGHLNTWSLVVVLFGV